ncbi:unnamed protein product [Adineta ricciae]|uniref:NACHT domain-containing protein n=1 Tax=Adineta ricciae TaxID=249248 RepID=A0A815N9G8_ADIRI|nr:unnamed protein product [Adineta ricciae]
MNEIIARAINSIDYLLEKDTLKHVIHGHTLMDIRDLFIKLNSTENEWTELFCRQLDRVMSNNKKLLEDYWINLYDDIIYALKGPNGETSMGENWNNFLKKITNEKKRMQREIQFQHKFGKRKIFKDLVNEKAKLVNEYLHNCIYVYSKVQIDDLIENINDFVLENCQLNEISVKEQLQRIDIKIDCSKHLLADIEDHFSTTIELCRTANRDSNTFFPSIESELSGFGESKTIETLLEYDRWIVILGDPRSGKSTLLRWILCIFAEAICNNDEQVNLNENHYVPNRFPILIRLTEFSTWLYENQSKTLYDYINNLSNDKENLFGEFIDHGHALILLDGLDEIDDIHRRGQIVDRIKEFINEFIFTPEFCSAFDDVIRNSQNKIYYEIGSPKITGGNQLIVTTRKVGYQFHPILGSFIHHYLLLLLERKQSRIFMKKWMQQVEKSILEILSKHGFELNEEKMKYLSNRRLNAIECIFKKHSTSLTFNPLLLCFICKNIFQLNKNFNPKSRIEIYDFIVQSILNSWPNQELHISKDILIKFLIHTSTYLHTNSSSNLIDAFDLKRLCQMVLKQHGNLSINHENLCEYTEKILEILQSKMNIISELGLEVFSFQHSLFQDYFVTQSLLGNSSIESLAKRIVTFTSKSRFRKSLLLTLGWISWKWAFKDYNQFCNLLVNADKSSTIPLGILLFFEGFKDLRRLPMKSVIFNALNHLLNCSINIIVDKYFLWNFLKLPENLIQEWMELHLKDELNLRKFCQSLLKSIQLKIVQFPNKLKSILPKIYQQLNKYRNQNSTNEFLIDQTFRRIILIRNAHEYIVSNEFSSYFSSNHICISTIHPLILSVICLVCGGLNFILENQDLRINFSSKQIFRQSSIIPSIVEYLTNSEESHWVKMTSLINYYENILEKTSKTDTSNEIIDIFMALICLKGLSIEMFYRKYSEYSGLSLAAIRLQQNWFYLKQTWISHKDGRHLINDHSLLLDLQQIVNFFYPKSIEFEKQRLKFSVICVSALNKFDINYSLFLLTPSYFVPARQNPQSTNKNQNSTEMIGKISLKSFSFIPKHLQNLYYSLLNDSNSKLNLLSRVLFRLQSLIHLENLDENDPNYYLLLSRLRSQFQNYHMENYLIIRLIENKHGREQEKQEQRANILFEQISIDEPIDVNKLIEIERQRISDANNITDNERKDLKLLVTSIILARLFQGEYRFENFS